MFRRQLQSSSSSSLVGKKFASTVTSLALCASSQQQSHLRFNSDKSNESEAEREARMRQEMMNRMMGGRNPFAGMFNQQQAAAAGSGAAGQQPPNQYFDTSNYNHWANTPFHRALRFWSSVLIFITGIYMMRRMGMMGDYSHLTLPFWAASPADQAKWILFIFNIQDARRRQLVQQWESEKVQNPSLNFFDFVDRTEQNWRSSPNFSGDAVITAISGAMRSQGPPRAITSIKATLSASNFFSSTIFGGTGNPAEERAQKIDNMMMNLGTALNPLGAMMGGGNSMMGAGPMSSMMFGGQQQGQQGQQQMQQQQQGGQQQGIYAIPTGFVSNSTQQMYGGMNPAQQQQLQQHLQQQGYNNPHGNLYNIQRYGGGGAGNHQTQPQWGNNNQNQQQQQQISTPPTATTTPSEEQQGKHACDVKFLNDQQGSTSSSSRPQTASAGAPEMKDQEQQK